MRSKFSIFYLNFGFNPGVSFGLFRYLFLERPLLLAGITVLVTAGLVIGLSTERRLETFALGLVAAGGMGNMCSIGYVRERSPTSSTSTSAVGGGQLSTWQMS